jgi:serine protease Do
MKPTPARLVLLPALVLAALGVAGDAPKDAPVGASYKVPCRLTQTNHYLVRVRINGKGPFNFLVDSGAPALFVGTEAARKVGLEADEEAFWTPVDRLDIEGGATLTKVKARVEDPFQLEGMNALGLPGARIDGILGFTILAKFRLELDPTRDYMVWTRLDHNPKEPFVPRRAADRTPPAEVQMMQALGPLMKFASIFTGKQPEDQLRPRGFLGIELAEEGGGVVVASVLPGSPAAEAGVQAGDRLVRLRNRAMGKLKAAHDAVAETRPGDRVRLVVRRGSEERDLVLTAAEGL